MSKKESEVGKMVKLGLILVCYAVASCTVLAIVNSFTSVRIKQNQIAAANKAMREVFSSANEFVPVDSFAGSTNSNIIISDFYEAKKDGQTIGAVVQISGPTYEKGKIILGLDINNKITGMQILELSDSPGFGLKANDPGFKVASGTTFYDQFTGKSGKLDFVVNQDFDGISGATITSKAIGELVHEGCQSIMKTLGGKQ